MGGCVSKPKDPKVQVLKKAYNTFKKLDRNKNDKITAEQIQTHFGAYSEASAKIMMREIDLDSDGIITKNQWLAYWEMVRRAGYRMADILNEKILIMGS